MKYHIIFKFLAVLFCSLFLFTAACSLAGIIATASVGLYNNSVEELKFQSMNNHLWAVADRLAQHCAATELSNCPESLLKYYIPNYHPYQLTEDENLWYFTVENENGKILESRYEAARAADAQKLEYLVTPTYPVVLDYWTLDPTAETSQPQDQLYESAESPDYLHIETHRIQDDQGITHVYTLGICDGPVYLVTIYLLPGAYAYEDHWSWDLADAGYAYRYHFLWILVASALLFAAAFVYLCCAAGKSPKITRLHPGGLNRFSLDVYAVLVGAVLAAVAAGIIFIFEEFVDFYDPTLMTILAVGSLAYIGCLAIVGFLFACAAQFKMPEGYWLRHTLLGITLIGCFKLLSRVVKWIWNHLPTFFGIGKQIVSELWNLLKSVVRFFFRLLGKIFGALWRTLRRFIQLLPLTWQWLLVSFFMVFVLLISLTSYSRFWQLFGVGVCVAIVVYSAHCFGSLLESTKRMSKGDLTTQVDEKLLLGGFRDYATHLNALAGVAMDAARKQMKSERMKAELVTNVSHDIKTPLTSIINYVDLLQKAETPEESQAYLEVLDRQSHRLKKLIDDLMEMSKASTGNISVELTRVEAAEAINQALGEFSEKLELAGLTPVLNMPETPVLMLADGRLTWRVLSNLLSNAVKYALPGTRLYIDVAAANGQVLVSLKNISKEQLNISPDELLERFVRGDASRNTEGSGLGLNIASSLMELQKGQLQLSVDGDLFKATLIFPMG